MHSHQMRTGTAVLAGAALGFLAGAAFSPTRKLALQGVTALAGDWADVLAAEHRAVEAVFAKLLKTTPKQRTRRRLMLIQIAHALNKHAVQEENVIYPALKKVDAEAAEHLISDHGDIKARLSALQYDLDTDEPAWIATVQDLATLVATHAREEEKEIFPRLKAQTSEDNGALTRRLHWEGIKVG